MSFIMFTIMDYMLDYIITSIFQVYHDILQRLNSISWKTVSRNFFTLIPVRHGGPLYLNIILKMSVLCFVFIIAINNNGVSNAF